MKYIIVILLSFIPLFGVTTSCVEEYYIYKVVNNSSERIYVCYDDFKDNRLLTSDYVLYNRLLDSAVEPGDTYKCYIFKYDVIKEVKYQTLIFKESTLNNYSKKELARDNIYDGYYSYTVDEFKSIHWKIVFTGE